MAFEDVTDNGNTGGTGGNNTGNEGGENQLANLLAQLGKTSTTEEPAPKKSQEEIEEEQLLAILSGENPDDNSDDPAKPADANFQILQDLITKIGGNEDDADELTTHFNSVFGDPIDFSAMMQDEGDPEEVNKQIQAAIQDKMKTIYADAITQSVQLAQQMLKKELDTFKGTFQQESAMSQLQTRVASELPATQNPENQIVLKALLPMLMKQTKNNVDQSVQLLKAFYRKTNKSVLATNNPSGRFGSRRNGEERPSSGQLTLDNLTGFLDQ